MNTITNYDWIQYYKKIARENQREICDLIMRNCKLEMELEETQRQLAVERCSYRAVTRADLVKQ